MYLGSRRPASPVHRVKEGLNWRCGSSWKLQPWTNLDFSFSTEALLPRREMWKFEWPSKCEVSIDFHFPSTLQLAEQHQDMPRLQETGAGSQSIFEILEDFPGVPQHFHSQLSLKVSHWGEKGHQVFFKAITSLVPWQFLWSKDWTQSLP